MHSKDYNYIKTVDYKHLSLWDVKRYVEENISFDNSIKLSEVRQPYHVPISKQEMIANDWQIISKISFAGNLFLRDKNDNVAFKGNLNKVDADSLIYSKINIKHGCIYYHPKGAIPFGVSSEYPVYKIDSTRVIGEFLVMVIRSNFFKDILNKKVTGISKARLKPNEFLDTEIPLPSLKRQEEMVSAYKSKLEEAKALELNAQQTQQRMNSNLLEMLGIDKREDGEDNVADNNHYLKLVKYSKISVWGTSLIRNNQHQKDGKYPVMKIKDLCQLGSGGTPSRSCSQYYKGTIPWIKTGEVLNEEIFDTEEHITEEAIANSSAKLYPKGSLIIAMYGQGETRGRTAKMGVDAATNQACAVLYNINNNIVSTDYLWYYLQGCYDDLRSLATGNNQPNLNAGKIKNYDIAIPPIDIQNKIATYIMEQKVFIKELRNKIQDMKEEATKQFENEIFK